MDFANNVRWNIPFKKFSIVRVNSCRIFIIKNNFLFQLFLQILLIFVTKRFISKIIKIGYLNFLELTIYLMNRITKDNSYLEPGNSHYEKLFCSLKSQML